MEEEEKRVGEGWEGGRLEEEESDRGGREEEGKRMIEMREEGSEQSLSCSIPQHSPSPILPLSPSPLLPLTWHRAC